MSERNSNTCTIIVIKITCYPIPVPFQKNDFCFWWAWAFDFANSLETQFGSFLGVRYFSYFTFYKIKFRYMNKYIILAQEEQYILLRVPMLVDVLLYSKHSINSVTKFRKRYQTKSQLALHSFVWILKPWHLKKKVCKQMFIWRYKTMDKFTHNIIPSHFFKA